MSRKVIYSILTIAVLLGGLHITVAGAAELFIKRSGSSSAGQAEKSPGKKELFLRQGRLPATDYLKLSPVEKSRIKPNGWEAPASWALLDMAALEAKKTQTDQVAKAMQEKESKVAGENAKGYSSVKDKMTADEAKQQAMLDPSAKNKAGTKKVSSTEPKQGTVIKRRVTQDMTPKKLFNTPD